ncbi:uncharacterized protein LOC108914017 [Anoplophora glabripennis]|uniref:uncharacterized protein LOC108914017 n=1 Tax=Anoplophora glabripennis TaxID=217634 RepID=UPI000873B514|nr:uncharacterized protein LOC108914017 [Anoplophora glabripennis]
MGPVSFILAAIISSAYAEFSAVDVVQDIYHSCISSFSVHCVKPKALQWLGSVSDNEKIKITEDLLIVKNKNSGKERDFSQEDIFDNFENFLQNHDLVAKAPLILSPSGPLGALVPRSFQPEDIRVPLAATGRSSKLVKKVIVPFLLGLKFKTAILVPLALALIALKTWKALTLGLLSLVLTGALLIFRLAKPKVVNYEVIHYPQQIEHHVEHPPTTGWEHPGYGRLLTGNEMAYNNYLN